MDLVEGEVRAEDSDGFLELAIQGVDAQVLDLVALGVKAPTADIGVSPFRADRDVVGAQAPLGEPAGEKALGATVGAGDVDAAHPGLVGGVEDLVGAAAAQRLGTAIGSGLRVPSGGDVRRTTECGSPSPIRAPPRSISGGQRVIAE